MSVVAIRPFEATDADYGAFALLQRTVWPEFPVTIDEWKHGDRTRDPQYLFRRFVAECNGTMVVSGLYCEPWCSMRRGKYWVNIDVHPAYRRRGIGSALYDCLTKLVADYNPLLILSRTHEDQTDACRFLTGRGFKQVMRHPISYLDVSGFDPKPLAGKLAK